MLLLEWNNPKTTIPDVELWLTTYLGSNYDGVILEDTKLWIRSIEPLNPEQEEAIKDWYYSLNDIARSVALDGPEDDNGRPLFKAVATEPQWHYSPRSLDFYTSKYGSLYNRSHLGDGTIDGSPDIGDAKLKFYDASRTELVKGEQEDEADFQIRLTANCTLTTMEFENTVDYDVFGAKVMILNSPAERAYLWAIAAPDVPKEWGGNVVFMGGGMNLMFFRDKSEYQYDGKTSSVIRYDKDYHSGKILLLVKHAVGEQIGIQFILQYYSAE